MRPAYAHNRTLVDGMLLALSENVRGVQVVKGFVRQAAEIVKFRHANREVRDQQRWIFWRISLFTPSVELLMALNQLALLGYDVAEATVAKYMVRTRKPPSQTWRTFFDNHLPEIAACDFFTVPTVTFRVLYVFIVLRHDRRQVVHFNVTSHPYAQWAAQQIVDAFPYEKAPRFLLRDRDGIYGDYFQKRVKDMGIEEVPIAPRSPWQNPYCERVIGSIRRDCLDHVVVLNEAQRKS